MSSPTPALDRYVQWKLETTHPAPRAWVGDAELRANLAAELQETWSERVDPQVLEQYAACCPVAGVAPAEYRLREIELPGGASVLAGIHFLRLDVQRPFVGIEAQSRALTHAELAQASRLLCKELEVFSPTRVWWWSSVDDDLRRLPGAEGDKRVLVGRLAEITAKRADLPSGFALEPDPGVSCYADYRVIYERLHRDVPGSAELARCEERDSLEACAAEGGLLCLYERGRLAGLLAARCEQRRGVPVWYVVDEILDAEYRGRGLAPVMQRAALARLDPARAGLVLGEIADRNLPSLRTAQRVGRLDAGGRVFVQAGWRVS